MSEWRPEGMLTSVEAAEKVIDYDGKPIRGNTRAGFLDRYERAERAMLAALKEQSTRVDTGVEEGTINLPFHGGSHGFVVFIPDKE